MTGPPRSGRVLHLLDWDMGDFSIWIYRYQPNLTQDGDSFSQQKLPVSAHRTDWLTHKPAATLWSHSGSSGGRQVMLFLICIWITCCVCQCDPSEPHNTDVMSFNKMFFFMCSGLFQPTTLFPALYYQLTAPFVLSVACSVFISSRNTG